MNGSTAVTESNVSCCTHAIGATVMPWSGVCCVGIHPTNPPLPGFTLSRDRAPLEEDRKAALRANVLFQSVTQGVRRRGPVRRQPTRVSWVNKEPSTLSIKHDSSPWRRSASGIMRNYWWNWLKTTTETVTQWCGSAKRVWHLPLAVS